MANFYIIILKTISVNICSAYALLKINNIKLYKKEVFISIMLNFLIGIIYAFIGKIILNYNHMFITNIFCYIFSMVLFLKMLKRQLTNKGIQIIISICFSLISKSIAGIINFILFKKSVFNNEITEYINLGIIQFLIIYFFFKIRRFKDGLSFINNKKINITMIIGIVNSVVLIIIAILLGKMREYKLVKRYCTIAIILEAILTFIWITKSLTQYYKERMKDRTVELQAEELQKKDKIINDLNTELANVLKINHKYSHRISAMERVVSKLGENPKFKEEFGAEYGDILDSLKDLSKEYKDELYEVTAIKNLPKTNIFSIDMLLEHMQIESKNKNIEMEVKINADINYMVENLIPKNKLETLLGDHIKDAIIAIEHSKSKDRRIAVEFNKNKENYEIKFYDTGIEFEIETLLKLGQEAVTTHKMTGGSGIGFMTTFETLKETKASLIIEEYESHKYTKAVIIKFDNKNEYRIKTYRAEEIKISSERVIIEKIL